MTSPAKVLPFPPRSTATLREECERAARLELWAYRRARGFTSAEALAQDLGCSPDSAERWLAGTIRVPGWVVVAITRRAA